MTTAAWPMSSRVWPLSQTFRLYWGDTWNICRQKGINTRFWRYTGICSISPYAQQPSMQRNKLDLKSLPRLSKLRTTKQLLWACGSFMEAVRQDDSWSKRQAGETRPCDNNVKRHSINGIVFHSQSCSCIESQAISHASFFTRIKAPSSIHCPWLHLPASHRALN